jgi:hypothetical protein
MSFIKKVEAAAKGQKTYEFIVDLDERGIFSCHVDDPEGKDVWSASTEDEVEGEFWPVRDGFMKHTEDMKGLENYLKSMKIMPKDAVLKYVG